MNIGFNKETKHYHLWNPKECVSCNVCHNFVENQFILNSLYNEVFKQVEQRPYCTNCFEKVKRSLDGCMTLVVIDGRHFDNLIPVLPDSLIPKPGGGLASGLCGVPMSDKQIANDMENPQLEVEIKGKGVAFDPGRNLQKLEHSKVDDSPMGIDWANAKRTKKKVN